MPYPTVATNRTVQTLVMTRPTGKMPRVRPGRTKVAAFAAADDVGAPGDVDDADLIAKMPLTKDASLDDSSVLTACPSLSVPVRAIRGIRRTWTLALLIWLAKGVRWGYWNIILRIIEISQSVRIDLADKAHLLDHTWNSGGRATNPGSLKQSRLGRCRYFCPLLIRTAWSDCGIGV